MKLEEVSKYIKYGKIGSQTHHDNHCGYVDMSWASLCSAIPLLFNCYITVPGSSASDVQNILR